MIPQPSRAAFSLVEIIAVMAVIAVLMTLTVPGVLSLLQASRLTAAADLVTARLNAARGQALALSSDCEVRFFTAAKGRRGALNTRDAIQLYRLDDREPLSGGSGAFVPAGPLEKLPEGIAFSLDKELSTLWQQAASDPAPESTSADAEAENRGDLELAATVRFHPDGSTALAGTELWCLTLVDARHREGKKLPANFATLTLDPATGRLQTYRPR